MEEDKIKLAFSKVKQDISFLTFEISSLKNEIVEIKQLLRNVHDILNTQKLHEIARNHPSTHNTTIRQMNTTDSVNSTHNTTVRQEIGGLKPLNLSISTGNEGVSTDRQTDRQTDTSTDNLPLNTKNTIESNIKEASEILESLDGLKRQIRFKFKKVTEQEMTVFSTIYQLEENNPHTATYKNIAGKLNLSESSIRDYVQRIVNKGIPIKKLKINNKKLILSISPELKKIATLSTILQLREL